MTEDIWERFDTDEEQEIPLEPLPPFADELAYLTSVAQLPIPTDQQIAEFVEYVAGAKSWYKHLPAWPPGAPMHFYLDPNAGRDRLRRWGHEVIYRDRTDDTEKFHYSWMTTEEYRQRFGYLAFSCPDSTGIWTDEMLEDGVAALDPNVSEPVIEGEPGRLVVVPEVVLEVGVSFVTRMVHVRTDARLLWQKWRSGLDEFTDDHGIAVGPLTGHWPRIAALCEELAREAPGVDEYLRSRPKPLPPLLPDSYPAGMEEAVKHVKALEEELSALIGKQRSEEHADMKAAIEHVLNFVQRSIGYAN